MVVLPHATIAAYAHVAHHTTTTTTNTQLPTQPTIPTSTSTSTSSSSTSTSGWRHGRGTSTSNSALKTALQTLNSDIQKIESASGTTVGQLTAIRSAFRTLSTDGLKPSSYSALRSFEDSLVTTNATPPAGSLTGNTTLTKQFIALYTSSPTSQQTTDLTTAYNALAAAVTSAGISSTDIQTINTDWSVVLTAKNSTSTAMFPYFTLVTGHDAGFGCGFGF